jgi:N-acylneuraminate cytidylyltransferase
MICVIPARGGSKRIPHKNIMDFCGKPMIAWSIEAAIESELFSRIIVSTDSQEIKSVAIKYGALAPFTRPDRLADDFATTNDVMRHAVLSCESTGFPSKLFCCLYATAPFVRASDLRMAFQVAEQGGWDYVFSAAEFSSTIFRGFTIGDNGSTKMLYPELFYTRSQDLESVYHDAGMFYLGTRDAWVEKEAIFGARSHPLVIPSYRVQDIDDQGDWRRAELMHQILKHDYGRGG